MIGEFFIIKQKIKYLVRSAFTDKYSNVLDLGCGNTPYYHENILGNIVCADIQKSSKAQVISDADCLPFKANSFDKVISVNSFYYFKNPFNVAQSIHKILKKDGKLVLVVPFFYPIHDAPQDKYRFTEYGLRAVLGDNFKIDRVETIGGVFNHPTVILHSLIKGVPLLFSKEARKPVRILTLILWPFYIITQLFSLLDVLDRTKRFPTYYFVIASKK